MRSYVLTAALAAALLSTSLTLGYAASPTNSRHRLARQRKSAARPARCATPAIFIRQSPLHYQSSVTRLAPVADRRELSAATRRIEADRRHGYLTAMETRKVRADERAIRAAAAETAHRNGGGCLKRSSCSLQERVTDLDRMIHRYANNSARA